MSLPLQLVIFDCDGVLVDSEATAARVCAREVTRLGWTITPEESALHFLGLSLPDMVPVIEAHTGRPVPAGWPRHLAEVMIGALSEDVQPMPGAAAALREVAALGLPYRVASNSSRPEMAVKFARCDLAELVAGRVHSAADVPRGKPAPDVYLAAAAAQGVPPAACLVVEDSVPGTEAAVAAGMTCVGLVPHGDGADLTALGATIIASLADLPPLLRSLVRAAA